jgi:cellulose synthase/poly-beta-1,6-N-acetylglucosamine synthase-like glycosyltransferase
MFEARVEQRPDLSVVIPTVGDPALLGLVLAGYDRQDVGQGTFEMIVVVDRAGREPGAVAAVVGERGYPVRVLQGARPGASANRNAGWVAARAPIVLFTDDDTVPVPSLVSEHLSTHAAHPEREVAVVGHIRWASGLKVTPFMRWLERGVQFDHVSLKGSEGTWAHLYTANASIKREMLELVGGYDEERLPYLYEDLDWGYRAQQYGLRVIYNRRAVVDHHKTDSVEAWQRRAEQLARAERTFCQLHPDVAPYFWHRFSAAARTAPGRGRGARLANLVPPWVPILGRAVWKRAGLHFSQRIAPYFMAAWDAAAADLSGPDRPDQPESGAAVPSAFAEDPKPEGFRSGGPK